MIKYIFIYLLNKQWIFTVHAANSNDNIIYYCVVKNRQFLHTDKRSVDFTNR